MRGIPLGQSWMANYFSVLIFAQKCAIYLPAKQFILFRVYLILRSAVQICKWIGAMYLGHSDARCVARCWQSSCASWEKLQPTWTIWRRMQPRNDGQKKNIKLRCPCFIGFKQPFNGDSMGVSVKLRHSGYKFIIMRHLPTKALGFTL